MLDGVIMPVATPAADTAMVRISSVRSVAAVRLKSWLPEHCRGDEPIAVGGFGLPRRVSATRSGPFHVLCLAPGEWLIVSRESLVDVEIQMQPALRQLNIASADLSDGFAAVAIEGLMTRTLLSKGCGLDLDSKVFQSGSCARTRFSGLPVVILCLAELTFELFVSRSYGDYLHEWMVDAAREWQLQTSTLEA